MNTNCKKSNEMLLNIFPELKEEFDKYTSWQEGINTGSTLVYEDIFVPYIIEQLINNNQNEIIKITSFIENLIIQDDEYGFNLAYVAILESLKSDKNGQKIKDYLKDNSLKQFNNIIY